MVELHVPQFNCAKDFYPLLGFQLAREEAPPKGYLVYQNDFQTLCFYGGDRSVYEHEFFSHQARETPKGYAVELLVFHKQIANCYQQLQSMQLKIVAPLKMRPWGVEDFRIVDPYGYYLRVTQPYDVAKPV